MLGATCSGSESARAGPSTGSRLCELSQQDSLPRGSRGEQRRQPPEATQTRAAQPAAAGYTRGPDFTGLRQLSFRTVRSFL